MPTAARHLLRLYGRGGCPLCDEMAAALRGLGFAFTEIDVDEDPALARRYGVRVPVLVDAQGLEICHGRLDEPALRRRLALE